MSRSGRYINQPTGYKALIPSSLPPSPPLEIDSEMQKLLSKADMALARLDGMGYILPNVNIFIAMYVKKEALLSSQIEGTQASLEELFQFESGSELKNINDVEEVVNYVKALNYGIERLDTLPMSLRLIKEIHEILMTGVRGGDKTPGEFRKSQNWIGPSGSTLKDATYVPPPPHETIKAMDDFELYMHKSDDLPVLINCALVHYQFETIHPFLDGNGRLGRLIITFYLYWKNILNKPLLYLSYFFKKNRQEYYDRLNIVRKEGDFEQWIMFFLRGVVETAESASETAKNILALQSTHRDLLWQEKISSPFATGVLDKLFYNPLITIREISTWFDMSYQAASTLISQFERIGILKEITGLKRNKRYLYSEYMNIISEGTKPTVD